jgi:hypothetical protein
LCAPTQRWPLGRRSRIDREQRGRHGVHCRRKTDPIWPEARRLLTRVCTTHARHCVVFLQGSTRGKNRNLAGPFTGSNSRRCLHPINVSASPRSTAVRPTKDAWPPRQTMPMLTRHRHRSRAAFSLNAESAGPEFLRLSKASARLALRWAAKRPQRTLVLPLPVSAALFISTLSRRNSSRHAQTRSTISAMPWPTPMHMVHSA